MAEEDTTNTAAVDDAASEAFGAGFAGVEDKAGKPDKTDTKPPANGKAEPARDASRTEAEPPPETVQITKKEWDEIKAAAAKTASYDTQLSRAFGTIGNMQKMLNDLRNAATPAAAATVAKKFEVPKEAFATMERDFPELAAQTRAALEAALSGLPAPGNDAHDPAKLESLLSQFNAKREMEILEDAYPDWRQRVGAIAVPGEAPDPNHPFRRWLASKPEEYQARLNNSESAAVITRAIRTFERETKAAPANTNGTQPRDTTRADRIRAAIQPRGDAQGAAPTNTAEEAFASGFTR